MCPAVLPGLLPQPNRTAHGQRLGRLLEADIGRPTSTSTRRREKASIPLAVYMLQARSRLVSTRPTTKPFLLTYGPVHQSGLNMDQPQSVRRPLQSNTHTHIYIYITLYNYKSSPCFLLSSCCVGACESSRVQGSKRLQSSEVQDDPMLVPDLVRGDRLPDLWDLWKKQR